MQSFRGDANASAENADLRTAACYKGAEGMKNEETRRHPAGVRKVGRGATGVAVGGYRIDEMIGRASAVMIKSYDADDEARLFGLMEREGREWGEYYDKRRERYKTALANSIVYVLYEDDVLCGFCRCRDDDGFGVYICDLLVDKTHRGKHFGRLLMTRVCMDYPNDTVYVMSDVDPYYEKQGCRREGSIFEVRMRHMDVYGQR